MYILFMHTCIYMRTRLNCLYSRLICTLKCADLIPFSEQTPQLEVVLQNKYNFQFSIGETSIYTRTMGETSVQGLTVVCENSFELGTHQMRRRRTQEAVCRRCKALPVGLRRVLVVDQR